MWRIHISHSVDDQHMRGNSVIHNVADTQVKGMRGIAQTATGNR